MKTIMKNLTGALLAAAALGSALPQSATHEPSLNHIKAQWPPETLFASALCQRALEDPGEGTITLQYAAKVDPKAFVPDLNSLMEKSDEVILATPLSSAIVLSPSREHVVTYDEVEVVRSWKGPHHAGDTLVLGLPAGELVCEPRPPSPQPVHLRSIRTPGPYLSIPGVYVLFLRQAKGDETKLVQGLFPAAGEGTQGVFRIPVPAFLTGDDDYCASIGHSRVPNHPNVVEQCNTFVQTSESSLEVYPWDPLRKKYSGMPASDFLREVQSVAD